jgi:hypothetical protein
LKTFIENFPYGIKNNFEKDLGNYIRLQPAKYDHIRQYCFELRLLQEMLRRLEICKPRNTPLPPQAEDTVERDIKSVEELLRKRRPQAWSLGGMDAVVCAVRGSYDLASDAPRGIGV